MSGCHQFRHQDSPYFYFATGEFFYVKKEDAPDGVVYYTKCKVKEKQEEEQKAHIDWFSDEFAYDYYYDDYWMNEVEEEYEEEYEEELNELYEIAYWRGYKSAMENAFKYRQSRLLNH